MSKELIVNKPQINPEVFKVGMPMHVHMTIPHTGLFKAYCLISKVDPFYVEVHYYNHKSQKMDDKTLHLEWIQQPTTKITILEQPDSRPVFGF